MVAVVADRASVYICVQQQEQRQQERQKELGVKVKAKKELFIYTLSLLEIEFWMILGHLKRCLGRSQYRSLAVAQRQKSIITRSADCASCSTSRQLKKQQQQFFFTPLELCSQLNQAIGSLYTPDACCYLYAAVAVASHLKLFSFMCILYTIYFTLRRQYILQYIKGKKSFLYRFLCLYISYISVAFFPVLIYRAPILCIYRVLKSLQLTLQFLEWQPRCAPLASAVLLGTLVCLYIYIYMYIRKIEPSVPTVRTCFICSVYMVYIFDIIEHAPEFVFFLKKLFFDIRLYQCIIQQPIYFYCQCFHIIVNF